MSPRRALISGFSCVLQAQLQQHYIGIYAGTARSESGPATPPSSCRNLPGSWLTQEYH